MNITKQNAPRVAAWLWLIGVILSGFLLSVPPGNLPIFIGLAGLSLIPVYFGSKGYRIFGVIAFLISVALITTEYQAGMQIRARMKLNRRVSEQKFVLTNTPEPSSIQPVTNQHE